MKRLFILLLLMPGSGIHAQQDALFTQYMYNKLEINPASAGSRDRFSMDLISRFQWTGIKGAPRTYCFSAQTPLPEPHIGLGLFAYRDELGPSEDYNIMASFAYRIPFRSCILSFGISGGIKYVDIDWTMLNPKDAGDPALNDQIRNKVVPDADFGIYLNGDRFYCGLSAKHLLENQVTVSVSSGNNQNSFTKLVRNFYGIGGMTFPLNEDFIFLPSVLIKYIKNTPVQADLNASFMFNKILTIGASYRTAQAMGLLVEVEVGGGFSIGYSYDLWFNALKNYQQGSHEIRLGYEMDLFGKNRMLTPRYF